MNPIAILQRFHQIQANIRVPNLDSYKISNRQTQLPHIQLFSEEWRGMVLAGEHRFKRSKHPKMEAKPPEVTSTTTLISQKSSKHPRFQTSTPNSKKSPHTSSGNQTLATPNKWFTTAINTKWPATEQALNSKRRWRITELTEISSFETQENGNFKN